MDINELLKQGVNAYQAGDNRAAYQFFRQAVQIEPNNPRALYYLAGVDPNLERKRKLLNKVLRVDPQYEPARRMLNKLPPPIQDDGEFSFDVPVAKPKNDMSLDDMVGADLKNQPQDVVSVFGDTFMSGIAVLRGQSGAYPRAIRKASWQRFMIYAVITQIIISIFGVINSAAYTSRFADYTYVDLNPVTSVTIITTLFLSVPMGFAILFASLYLSHQFVIHVLHGRGSLLAHSYAIALPTITINLVTIIPFTLLALIPVLWVLSIPVSLVIGIYAWVIVAKGTAMVHKLNKGGGCWTLVVLFIIQGIMSNIFGIVFSPFLIGGSSF